LTRGNAAAATRDALTWLDTHHTAPDAQFVLRGLLDRPDLTPAGAAAVIVWCIGTNAFAYDFGLTRKAAAINDRAAG
jgi:hypothetical protein